MGRGRRAALGTRAPRGYKGAPSLLKNRPPRMSHVILHPLYLLIDWTLDAVTFVVIAAVVVSWLITFGIVNLRNPTGRQVVRMLDAVTEPLFRPIRRIVPPMGGLDFSPIIVLLAVYILHDFVDGLFHYLGVI